MKSRVIFLDVSRALSMLWIVAIWHVVDLNSFKPGIEGITIGVLALFTFISGYFLGGELLSKKDICNFYIKRLKRFWPLYAISCVTLYILYMLNNNIAYIDSFKQMVLTMTGLACFIPPMPLTIWYFCMIIVFYFITPFITCRRGVKGKIVVAALFYTIIIISYFVLETDIRLIMYYPFYVLGLLFHNKVLEDKFDIKKMGLLVLFMISSIVLYTYWTEILLIQLLTGLVVMLTIMEFSKLFTNNIVCTVMSYISYASMCAYLFHRQYYTVVGAIIGDVPWIVKYIIIIPLLIVFSGILQRFYDILVGRIEHFRR